MCISVYMIDGINSKILTIDGGFMGNISFLIYKNNGTIKFYVWRQDKFCTP